MGKVVGDEVGGLVAGHGRLLKTLAFTPREIGCREDSEQTVIFYRVTLAAALRTD